MNLYTDARPPASVERVLWQPHGRTSSPAAGSVVRRPWIPPDWAESEPGPVPQPVAAAPGPPPMVFGEAEVASLTAAAAAEATSRARSACAAELAAQKVRAMAEMAGALTEAVQARRGDGAEALAQVVDLADAIAGALLADAPRQAGVLAAIRSMLATLASQAAVRLVVATADATSVQAVLAELAADCGFKGDIELAADPRLTVGAVQLLWPDGWLEHAPEIIRHQVDAILAAHRAPEPGSSLSGACPGSAATSTGDDHALA